MTLQKLWLSQIDETFTSEDAIIGPWCFEGNEAIDKDLWQRDFSNPFDNADSVTTAAKHALALFEDIVAIKTEEFNQTHKLDHSYYFWRHVSAGWLLFLIHTSWVRYSHIKAFIQQHAGEKFKVNVTPKEHNWNLLVTHDLVKNAPSPDFDFWLSSFIVGALAPNGWELNTVQDFKPQTLLSNYKYKANIPLSNLRDYLRYPLRLLLYWVLRHSRFGSVYGMGWKERLYLSLYLSLKPAVKNPIKPLVQKKMIEGYNASSYFPQEYLNILQTLIEKTCPHSLMEGFSDYYAKASNKNYKAGKIRVISPDIFREVEKIENALAVENNEIVLQTQHGSWYGMVSCPTVSQPSEYGFYGFLTWGWDSQDDISGNFIPTPSPMLAPHIGSYQQRNNHLLFVNNKTYTRSSRLEGQPMPSQTIRDRQLKLDFINQLRSDIQKDLYYRPHMHHSFGLDDTHFVKEHCPQVQMLLAPSVNDTMMSYKLFVANHYSTGFHIAMAAGMPCVCFWPKDIIPIAKSAMPEHQALMDNKIIFDDPIKAADHINTIWNDIDSWWQSDEVKKARNNWCQKFSYTNQNYMKQWRSILSKVGHDL